MPNQQSQIYFQLPSTNLEINSPLNKKQDPDLQHQRQVHPTIRLRNLEGNQGQHPQTLRHLSTDALGTSLTSDGLKLSQTNNYGTGPDKFQSSLKSGNENRDGLATQYASLHQMPPGRLLTGTHKGREREAGLNRPGVGVSTQKRKQLERPGPN